VQFDGWTVDDEMVEWFSTLRLRGVERIIITTNKAAKDEVDIVQLQAWAEQIGADALFSPMDSSQRKPSPYMLLSAMQHFDIQPDSMFSVGDKLHGDVLASNLARVHSTYLTKLHGTSDHPGDRFFKRPFIEKPMYVAVRNHKPEIRFTPKPVESDMEVADYVRQNPKGLCIDPYIVDKASLIGYATPPIVLSPEYRAKIPPPQFEKFTTALQAASRSVKSSSPVQAYAEYLREHGEDHAEWLTEKRKTILAPTIGALIISSGAAEYMKLHNVAKVLRTSALIAYATSHVTDGLDGLAIRMSGADLTSKRRIEGADEDRRADQEVSDNTGYGLVISARKDPLNQAVQSIRVRLRRAQTKKWTEKGYDTKSDRVSKLANEFQGVADTLSLKNGLSRKTIVTQSIATALKYASMINSERRIWPYRKARLEAAAVVLEQLKQPPALK
jgi:predicted HAD superfamily phosphohydrolase YqeG